MEKNNLQIFAHNDIEDAVEWYKIPLCMYDKNDVYLMQEDRCVFVGCALVAVVFIEKNNGKYCKSKFPL